MNLLIYRTLWSVLPLLGLVPGMKSGVFYGTVGAGIFLAAVLLFMVSQPFFPSPLHRLLFCLILLSGGVPALRFLAPEAGTFSFFLLASLAVLAQPELFRKRKNLSKMIQKNLLAGCAFAVLMAAHGILSQGMSGILIFPSPAGSFFLLGLASIFLPGEMKK